MKISDFGPRGVYRVGQVVNAKTASYERERTEPPRRYTQSDLMDAMMSAYRFASNEQERAVLKQISGLGTSRTRESTITGLITRTFLVPRKSQRERGRVELIPSEAARTIIANLPEMLTSVAMTAKWELAFRLVEQGKTTAPKVIERLQTTLNELVKEAQAKGSIAVQHSPVRNDPKKNQFTQKAAPPRPSSLRPSGHASTLRT